MTKCQNKNNTFLKRNNTKLIETYIKTYDSVNVNVF